MVVCVVVCGYVLSVWPVWSGVRRSGWSCAVHQSVVDSQQGDSFYRQG